jgi:hypothetical protein
LIAEGTGRLIVTEDGRAVGVLTEHDVLAARPTQRLENADPGSSGDRRSRSLERDAERESETEPTQSICEVCGTLSATLEHHDGRLVCPDCQEV